MAVVIPAFNESKWICHTIESLGKSMKTAGLQMAVHVVVVVNNPLNFGETGDNVATLQELKKYIPCLPLAVLDHTPGLAHGVGEARNLGMLHAMKCFELGPEDLLLSLDADTLVAEDYFSHLSTMDTKNISAFTLGFEHDLGGDAFGIALYECYLRYMKWNLTKCGSPFDFYTIGSSLGTTVKNYRLSGGFMKRPATEDYHLLNKLRKLGEVAYWPHIKVFPSARESSRVFLGTGHFLSHFDRNQQSFPLVMPDEKAFTVLKNILSSMRDMYENEQALSGYLAPYTAVSSHFEKHRIVSRLADLRKNSLTKASFLKKIPQVFDGLQTLRVLKILQGSTDVDVPSSLWRISRFLRLEGEPDPVSLLREFRRKDSEWSIYPQF